MSGGGAEGNGTGARLQARRDLLDVLRGEQLDGEPMRALTVMRQDLDPFRIGTPGQHEDARYVADLLARHPTVGRIHARGLHYLAIGGPPRPGQTGTYVNDEKSWRWMQEAVKNARWLGYTGWERITDERNEAPIIRLHEESTPAPGIDTGAYIEVAEIGKFGPTAYLGQVRVRQPFRLALFSEKSALGPLLTAVAEEFGADLYLGTGETSDTLVHTMARVGDEDGRPLVVVTVCDFDPSGWQMPISIAHKLRALHESLFPTLEFVVIRAGVLVAHVEAAIAIEPEFPSSVLKESEKRAELWREAWRLEQTELDPFVVRQPALLRAIVREACAPYFDSTLTRRIRRAVEEWHVEARASMEGHVDFDRVTVLEAEVRARRDDFLVLIRACREELEEMVAGVELPEFEVPEPWIEEDDLPEPLVSSDLTFREHVGRLQASKRYKDGR